MKKVVFTIGLIVLALAATEGLAYWWMHPAPAGLGQPVLDYRPQVGPARRARPLVANGVDRKDQAPAIADPSPSSTDNPTSDLRFLTSVLTPLPDLYAKAAPLLHCSNGSVYHASMPDAVSIHFAFFEWNRENVGSIFEAFRHMPESCMGSIGMTLVSVEPTRSYQLAGETLLFDHTVFLDKNRFSNSRNPMVDAPLVHSFKAVWVSGLSNVAARDGLLNYQEENLRQARLKAAITRFRPSHARVFQGAVRGAANADAAWNAFEIAMLKDLRME